MAVCRILTERDLCQLSMVFWEILHLILKNHIKSQELDIFFKKSKFKIGNAEKNIQFLTKYLISRFGGEHVPSCESCQMLVPSSGICRRWPNQRLLATEEWDGRGYH